MSTRKIGYAIAIIGVLGVLLSVLVDYIGLGDDGIQAAQILGILAGLMLTIFGLTVALQVTEKQIDIGSSLRAGFERLLDLPVGVWFVIGFFLVFIWLFVFPVFLNTDRSMVYFNRFLPNRNPIGFDLNYTTEVVRSWVTTGQSPYPDSYYPPLTYILLSPLTLLDYPASYALSTFLTLFSYVVVTLWIPALLNSKRDFSLIAIISITGLFSYGFQFELERGQYYTVAFLLCLLAIYIFHRHYEYRYLAYVFFSISVHLKIAPIFFILMFVKDWRDWKGNLKRMAGLGLFNIALLFVLGYRNLLRFFEAFFGLMRTPTFLWNGNHSLSNFVSNFVKDGFGLLPESVVIFLQQHAKGFERTLLFIIALGVFSIIFHMYRSGKKGFNPYLLLVCTICALIIPVSVDYTLPMLVAPMAIFLSSLPELNGSSWNKVASILLILILSISYVTLLYPFKYKPYFLNNSFPALFLILVAATVYYFLQGKNTKNDLDPQELVSE